MGQPTVPARSRSHDESSRVTLDIPTPALVGAASGILLFTFFTILDSSSILSIGAVFGYWALFACTYFILGQPGKDWRLPRVPAIGQLDLSSRLGARIPAIATRRAPASPRMRWSSGTGRN